MLLALILVFAIGWCASAGLWGLVVIFAALEFVELYRRGQKIQKLQRRVRVHQRLYGPR